MTWHLGNLVAFDIESTGVDVETARIVTACVALIDGSGQNAPKAMTWLINPGVEIPAEATKVHGITTERARAEGRAPMEGIADIASKLFATAAKHGAPIVAFNACYDLTVLDRECRRNGIPVEDVGPVIDPFVLDKNVDRYRRGRRNLTAACEHYGVRLDGAHDASFDAVAAARVAWKIAQQYPEIAEMGLPELHALQVAAKREQDASFAAYRRSRGESVDGIDGAWPMRPFVPAAVTA